MVQTTCPACGGTGHALCYKCGGTGRQEFNPWEVPPRAAGDCARCGGSGRDPSPDPKCHGTGRVVKEER